MGHGQTGLSVADRLDITDCVSQMVWYADRRDMEADAELYDDTVTFDYGCLFGGDPVTLDRRELLAMFDTKLRWFGLTHHLITSTHVTGGPDIAEAHANVRAIHTRDTRAWVFYGYYTVKVRRTQKGWKIFHQQVTSVYQEGDDSVRAEWVASV